MGKIKESYSAVYYASKDDFFADIEAGENQPTYVGLLDIVRVLKLVSQNRKQKAEEKRRELQMPLEAQLSLGAS